MRHLIGVAASQVRCLLQCACAIASRHFVIAVEICKQGTERNMHMSRSRSMGMGAKTIDGPHGLGTCAVRHRKWRSMDAKACTFANC